MPEIQIEIGYVPHNGQLQIHKSNARYKIVPAGRRVGKTYCAVGEQAKKALCRRGNYAWLAPTATQTDLGFNLMTQVLDPRICFSRLSYPKKITLINGSVITFLSADKPDTIRGNGFDGIVVDEAQLITEKAWYESIEPTISQTQGWALIIGTPFGRGLFYNLYTKGLDPNYPDYESFNFPSNSNPYFPQEEWERLERELPSDTFRQEYEAEFLDDSAGVFRGVSNCIDDRDIETSSDISIGVDLAKHVDYTVLLALCKKTGRVVEMQRFNKIDWGYQKDRIKEFYVKYRGEITIDSTGVGDAIYDDLYKMGMRVNSFKFTSTSKREIIQNLSAAIELQQVSWNSQYSDLTNELQRYEYKISETTKQISYNAPAGYHDDTVIALALAVHGWKQARDVYVDVW